MTDMTDVFNRYLSYIKNTLPLKSLYFFIFENSYIKKCHICHLSRQSVQEKWIWFVDSDDIVEMLHVPENIKWLKEHDYADLVIFDLDVFNDGDSYIYFNRISRVGRGLQYIGKLTLDIYLLHYYFLPRNMNVLGIFFKAPPNPTIEQFVSGIFALMVISLCLAVSSVVKLSPVLAHWLFGVKIKR